jgi:hypothetical protein
MVDLLHVHHAEALARWQRLAEQFPQAHVAAEALFWAGIAAFRSHGKDKEVLRQHWEQLHTRYAHSTWWRRADVFGKAL